MIELASLMHMEVTLEPVRDLGATPLGRRRIIGITGGKFTGPRLSGRVLPGGADWQLIRAICVATGARRPAAVELDFFEVK